MNYPDLTQTLLPYAEKIIQTGASLHTRGYVHGTTGNISVRVQTEQFSGYLITPTDASLGQLQAHRMSAVDLDGHQRYGDRASKTIALHRAIYSAQPEANAVIHTHSHHLVLLTLLGVWKASSILPPITPYQVMKVGPVPLVGYAVPGHESVVKEVVQRIEAMQTKGVLLRAVMCDRLGPQVWHQDLSTAMAVLEELEQTARLWIDAERSVQPLARSQLDALRERFGCVWAD
jgi:ribulose-5-phosphate 4-epimerase/fuculose-1-phosphate aldolase